MGDDPSPFEGGRSQKARKERIDTMNSISLHTATAAPSTSGEHRRWWFLDTLVVELRSDDPTVLEITVPLGGAPPEHMHAGYDDSFLLLDGEVVVAQRGELFLARPGDWVCTPAGTPHAFRVIGDRPARLFSVFNHRSFLDLIQALGEPALTNGLPPGGRGPEAATVFEAFARHDVNVTGDSLDAEQITRFLRHRKDPLSAPRR
jgi:quercetin dioxygenase-like cupin family protein